LNEGCKSSGIKDNGEIKTKKEIIQKIKKSKKKLYKVELNFN